MATSIVSGIYTERQIAKGTGVPPALYTFTDVTLTSGGATGRFGPTLAQAISGATSTGNISWKNNTAYFNVTSTGIMLWQVPQSGTYRIETWGAQGGNPGGYSGGYGSRMRGDFSLISGEIIKILVGQTGTASYGGGGGGTFVTRSDNTPLIVSGGGNSASAWSSVLSHAPTTSAGLASSSGGPGGSGGSGGIGGNNMPGGAGLTGDGGASTCGGSVPLSFTNGGTGGATCNSGGGFGGGSGSDGCCQGAGGPGGGYSGGGAGSGGGVAGGAGGSYNAGANQSNDAGNTGTATLAGNGKVIITKI